MGYRSQVVIYIRHPKIHERFKELAGEPGNEAYVQELLKGSGSAITLSPPDVNPPWLLMQYNDVKWYDNDSYPGVQRDTALYDEFADYISDDDNNNEYGCAFVRVGEDSDDIESRNEGHGYEVAYPTTSIEVNL